jgi:DNA-binding NtrC family response regulator
MRLNAKMKLLIIDDHDIVRQGVRRLLSILPDSEVAEAGTVEEGFEAYMREKPAVVVLDINLAGGSGWNFSPGCAAPITMSASSCSPCTPIPPTPTARCAPAL